MIDVLARIGYSVKNNSSRNMKHLLVYEDSNLQDQTSDNLQNNDANLTKEETIKNNILNNNDMLKSNITGFFDFLFKESFGQQPRKVRGLPMYAHQPLGYFLPAILIVDVRAIASNLVNPKTGVSFNVFKKILIETDILLNEQYVLRGLVCCTKETLTDKPSPVCYAVKVDGDTATGYLGQARSFPVNKLDDRFVIAMVLERKEVDQGSQ